MVTSDPEEEIFLKLDQEEEKGDGCLFSECTNQCGLISVREDEGN